MKTVKSHFPFSIYHLTFYFFLFTSSLFPQTHFTVPENVWRINVIPFARSGKYIGPGGIDGIPDMEFSLGGYGKQYFDHGYVLDGYYSSDNDLYDLDSLGHNANFTVGQYIRFYNQTYGDSVPDLSEDFFGLDSIAVSGRLSQLIERTEIGVDFSIEYGLSNRITFEVKIPYFSKTSETRTSKWKSIEIDGLYNFINYHNEARAAFDSALVNQPDVGLQNIYDRFYTWEGRNSLLWALGGDPFVNGIYGADYNPFANDDTTAITMDSIMAYYYPSSRSSSGLGDVELGLKILLFGKPAWSETGNYSIYAGFSVLLPSADRLRKYKYSPGIPVQQSHYSVLPQGDGVTRLDISFFGELYRKMMNRDININWFVRGGVNIQERLFTPISFLNFTTLNPDTVATLVGIDYTYKKGNELAAAVQGNLELIPNWISVMGGASIFLKGRDEYISKDSAWDSWMRSRDESYDTRQTAIRQFAELVLHNSNPLKKIGPIPFDIRGGVSIPVYTRNTFSNFSAWLTFTVYAQAW